ncbi:MAG: RNA methyltransferase [Lachnospiraceae bacterium]|nr:RNA methyltransferase [Lachnospiraceae bacterium]
MKIREVVSAQNSMYKQIMRYQSSREAKKANVFIVEGVRAVEELLLSPEWKIESLWVSQERLQEDAFFSVLKETLPESSTVYVLPSALLSDLADTQSPQGVLAVVKRKTVKPEELFSGAEAAPLYVVLENLQDPGNLGTILRTADSAGAAGVLYTKGTVDIYNAKVVRAAMGSLLHIPVCAVETIEEAGALLHAHQVKLLGAHLKAASYHFEQDLTGPVAIMIGNEGAGLSVRATEQADDLVKIPMLGRAESLNAAMAAGILMYETVRQRLQG